MDGKVTASASADRDFVVGCGRCRPRDIRPSFFLVDTQEQMSVAKERKKRPWCFKLALREIDDDFASQQENASHLY